MCISHTLLRQVSFKTTHSQFQELSFQTAVKHFSETWISASKHVTEK